MVAGSRSRSPAGARKPSARAASRLAEPGRAAVSTELSIPGVAIGKSVWPAISAADSTPATVQHCMLALSALALLVLPLLPSALVYGAGLPATWDAQNGVGNVTGGAFSVGGLATLLEKSLDLPAPVVRDAARLTVLVFAVLLLADVQGASWPRSWRTHKRKCYTDMFCEPSRLGRLVQRPGNTVSNAVYIFGGICILQSSIVSRAPEQANVFWASDLFFGVMMLVLAALSVIWHASNAPAVHYLDLWSMDSCIGYLIVRFLCLGELYLLKQGHRMAVERAEAAAALSCLGLYALVVLGNARVQHTAWRQGLLEDGFPLSGRARLAQRGQPGNFELHTWGVCLFSVMPVIYMVIPTLVQLYILRSAGSVLAATVAAGSLSIGWGARMFERFVLDGYAPMNLVLRLQQRQRAASSSGSVGSFLLTFAAATVSPTALLHWFTGVTLFVGYMHVRSMDEAA